MNGKRYLQLVILCLILVGCAFSGPDPAPRDITSPAELSPELANLRIYWMLSEEDEKVNYIMRLDGSDPIDHQGCSAISPNERYLACNPLHGKKTLKLIDLQTGATFQQVTEAPLGPLAMSLSGNHALITVFDDNLRVNELHAVDLRRLTLQMESVPLTAMPRNAGTLPGSEIGYVDQEHPYGKITFIGLDSMLKRAVTGYELNADD